MELNYTWIALLFAVISVVVAGDHSSEDDSSEEGGHHHGGRKKAIVLSIGGVIIFSIITAVVVICICKKKKANLKRTEPSGVVIMADPLPAKQNLSNDYNTNNAAVYNITPNYVDVTRTNGQTPPPAYNYDQ